MQGKYELAKEQCNEALLMLNDLPETDDNIQRKIIAWMNLGTAFRHSEEYDQALLCYQQSRKIAEERNNRDALCSIFQHIGINQHLLGRQPRRSPEVTAKEIAWACRRQSEAWKYLTDALQIAWESNLESAVSEGLGRLARVYREVYHLEQMPDHILSNPDVIRELESLKEKCASFDMVFEIEYENELIFPGAFSSLKDWREKVARLYDVSALAAEEVNDFHRALDSLTELSRTLTWLFMLEKVPLLIKRIERIKGYDFQEYVYSSVVEILRGDLELRRGQLNEALYRYRDAYIDLARASGFATYELNNRLRDLEWRIREYVPADQQIAWCDKLEDAWIEAGLATTQSNMIHRLERLRREFSGQENT